MLIGNGRIRAATAHGIQRTRIYSHTVTGNNTKQCTISKVSENSSTTGARVASRDMRNYRYGQAFI